MTLQSILSRSKTSKDELIAALSESDPLRIAAATALAEQATASESGLEAWKALLAKDARAALLVARFIEPCSGRGARSSPRSRSSTSVRSTTAPPARSLRRSSPPRPSTPSRTRTKWFASRRSTRSRSAIGATTPCDLRPHVPPLVKALNDKTRPDLAPGSGLWKTNGVGYSATQALALAVRWDATATTVDAVVAAMNARAELTASNAAFALARGLGMAGRLAELAPHLSHERPEVRVELCRAIAAVDVHVPRELAAAIGAMRKDGDRSVAQAARWVAIEGDALDDARARACRIVDKVFRSREIQRISTTPIDEDPRSLIAAALVEILEDPDDRTAAVRALARLAEQGTPMVAHVRPMLDAIRDPRDVLAEPIARAPRRASAGSHVA